MKKAVIETGGKQYLVSKDDVLDIELVGDKKTVDFEPLLVFDDDKPQDAKVGAPTVKGVKVKAKVEDQLKGDKVIAIRFKAKKRVNKKRGHRQQYSRIKITDIK